MTCAGLPHSGISGSTPVSGSPKLIAACYALLRPLAPRNPPQALLHRSEERRVGKSVDLGGRRIIKKKKKERRGRRYTLKRRQI